MKLLITLLFFFIIVACNKQHDIFVPTPTPTPTPTPSPVVGPDEGEPLLYKTGFKKPKLGLAEGSGFAVPEEKFRLPKSFDWRKIADVPVQNQGACGSCWAFSTIASVDYAYAIYGEPEKFSEQELVDCAPYYGCQGGFFAGDWVVKNGVATEKSYPYQAVDQKCKSSESINVGKIISWANIGQPNKKPSVKELKQAILQYGPIAVDVAASSSWDYYKGGVKKNCGAKSINHMVNIVGWDGKGNWIMRNSWGEKWGDAGYALMPYGCDSIASDAAYVVVEQLRRK